MVVYRLLDHTADLGFECEAKTLEQLFATAVLALADIISKAPLDATEALEVRASGSDDAARLRALLDEVLFRFETRSFLPKEASVTISGDAVAATLRGVTIDAATTPIDRVVKAVTYHGLEVAKKKGGWRARVILDL